MGHHLHGSPEEPVYEGAVTHDGLTDEERQALPGLMREADAVGGAVVVREVLWADGCVMHLYGFYLQGAADFPQWHNNLDELAYLIGTHPRLWQVENE
jgi:hypothetical protein